MRRLIILFAIFCASCSGYAIKPYKMDIQQGNVVTSKMMLQLRPGMTKSQVRFIMGTPLIADSFHKDRWDYFYQMRKDGKIIEQRRVILDFENDALKSVRGDVIPAGSGEGAVAPEGDRLTPPKQEEKSLVDKLKFWKKDEKPAAPQSAPEELVKPETTAGTKAQEPRAVVPELVQPEAMTRPAPADNSQDLAFPAPKPAAEILPAGKIEPPAPVSGAAQPAPVPVKEAPAKLEDVKTPAATRPGAEPVPAPKKVIEAPARPAETASPQAPATDEPRAAPRPAAAAEEDLPPEEDPGYFEKMLEKIGF